MIAHPASIETKSGPSKTPPYAWLVFALTFGLLLSDYMSRQVLNAVFPLLKAEWNVSDAQLGSLSGVVSLAVGLLAFPLSVVADRVGRVKSLVAMATLWSLATLVCGLARNYDEMLIGRVFVGVGEAAYGSIGLAVLMGVFPVHMRATITAAFLAGSMLGNVLGVSVGGVVAQHYGWRAAFYAIAAIGLALAAAYFLIVREPKSERKSADAGVRPSLLTLFDKPALIAAYLGSGTQLFVVGAVVAWMPSFLNRHHDMATDKAGLATALILLASGVGMVFCANLGDRLAKSAPERMVPTAIAFCITTFVLLFAAFHFPPSPAQLALIGAGMFFSAGATGPAGAMVANLAHPSRLGAGLALLALGNNLFGLAPGPVVTGFLADRMGLDSALGLAPLMCLIAALVFFLGGRDYVSRVKSGRTFSKTPAPAH